MKDERVTIKIKYQFNDMKKLDYIDGEKSDWIDLRSAETFSLKAGEFKLAPLGVVMELPDGYEAHIAPRSSTFAKFGIIIVNSPGCIDQSYCGDSDMWFTPVLAFRDTTIYKGDRICQFRIMKKQPKIEFQEVTELGNPDRGGHGSTGTN